tara:strand:- start:99 stop:512 length:414 start_codon:yes stop_codon:yes gene_type:complete
MPARLPVLGLDPRLFTIPNFVSPKHMEALEKSVGRLPDDTFDGVNLQGLELFVGGDGSIIIQPGTVPLQDEQVNYPTGFVFVQKQMDGGKVTGARFTHRGYTFDIDFSRQPSETPYTPSSDGSSGSAEKEKSYGGHG